MKKEQQKKPKAKERSPFRSQVYAVVRKIPKGKVLTYGEVAQRAGNPHAARAVGMYMSKNYDPTVPCHRVIRKDGGLGGYNRGGTSAKMKILKQEGCVLG